MSHSQGSEQTVLGRRLPATGRFLDIGAHDGQTFSNTFRLAEQGWAGVCVEPAPALVARLLAAHADHDVTVVCAAVVVDDPGWATFWDTDTDCLSTLSVEHRDSRPADYTPLVVYTVTLASLLERVGTNFDFVSIDTEGSSVDLAEALPLEEMPDLRVVCVENDRPVALDGFERVWRDGNNTIFVRNS